MDNTQDWIEAYKELCKIIKKGIEEVTHVDLWHEQTNYEAEEYPYPMHSVFFEFNTDNIKTIGNNVQDINAIITVYHVFDTLSDTYDQSENQSTALEFGKVIRKIHKTLQGVSGNNFSSLDRTGLGRHPSKEYLLVYKQTYACQIIDYSGQKEYSSVELTGISVQNEPLPLITPDRDMYQIPR